VDANQFDELIARLADGPSRRDALKGLAGGALASVGIGAALTEAEGKKGKGRKKSRGKSNEVSDEKKGKCQSKNKRKCGGKCRKITTNKRCGSCKNRCATDEQCVNKVCVPLT
jgi:hypothetical protein